MKKIEIYVDDEFLQALEEIKKNPRLQEAGDGAECCSFWIYQIEQEK